ncbi:nuclear transport factor 2 family protein [Frankia sp. AgB1.9]|uniref:nuclear transport factor 2 family protein n=1 Tax=unclassified Frankia TaxID=2632575 RepID=UPI0019330957|nr:MULTISPECIES: nuclear transport factor 2 family protein [unclassified Frankia]MBL7493176.1 nuclear transport factor 2 family protein [Frankia sp. AgW1.1]MBL7550746.1 nuclear transport factor 2 family protein [Frankia sp. AgB1.9]MBL7624363.1 nuclear transport factor 2 family protein [Frankia sp. AgB1.8]
MSSDYGDAAARIRDTIAAYAQAVDDARTEDIVATFLPDGWASFPGAEPARGHEGIRATYSALTSDRVQRHVVTNILISDFDGKSAKATSDLLFLVKGEKGWSVRLVGRYTDRLRQDGDAWLFESRELVFL